MSIAGWRAVRANDIQIAIGDGQEFVSVTVAVDDTLTTADELAQEACGTMEFPPWSPTLERLDEPPSSATFDLDTLPREPWPTAAP
jgi:hypothetical protein